MFFPVEVRGYSNLCNAGDKLEPLILFRIVEVLQSTYKVGNLQITEQLSFLSLLMAQFDVNRGEYLKLIRVGSY
jgi:pre-rRNA-processing protein IPI1